MFSFPLKIKNFNLCIKYIGFIYLYLCVISLFSIGGRGSDLNVLFGLVQLFLVFFVFIVMIAYHKEVDCNILFKYLLYLFYFILTIAIFERLGLFLDVIETIRSSLYSKSLYEGFERDLAAYGFNRPMALMKEPAHLAWVLSLVLFCLYKAKAITNKNTIIFAVLCFYITYSPIFMLFFLAYSFDRVYKKPFLLFPFFLVIIGVFSIFFNMFEYRYNAFLSGTDLSTISRIVAPPLVALKVFIEHPLFGIGITSHSNAFNYIYDVFMEYGNYNQIYDLDNDTISKRITNYFFEGLIYFGVVGFTGLLFLAKSLLNKFNSQISFYYLLNLFFLFSIGMGGIVTPRVTVALALLYVTVKFYNEKVSND